MFYKKKKTLLIYNLRGFQILGSDNNTWIVIFKKNRTWKIIVDDDQKE